MKKDIVKNAVICLSHLKIEDTTYEIARDIVIEEYEEQKEEIERLNNIIKNLDKMFEYYFLGNLKYDQDTVNTIYIKYIKLKELKGDSSNERI